MDRLKDRKHSVIGIESIQILGLVHGLAEEELELEDTRGVDVPEQLAHGHVLVLEQTVGPSEASLILVQLAALLLSEAVSIGDDCSCNQLILTMSIDALLSTCTVHCIKPLLADMSLPVAVCVGTETKEVGALVREGDWLGHLKVAAVIGIVIIGIKVALTISAVDQTIV